MDIMGKSDQTKLYWTGGEFRVSVFCWIDRTQEEVDEAVGILEEFRTACRKQYIAFNGLINGRSLAYERFSASMKPEFRDRAFLVGTGPPDGEQELGRSTIASMTQRELIDGLRDGGEFEKQRAKAVIVFIYHLWEDYFRDGIARAVRVTKNKVASIICPKEQRLGAHPPCPHRTQERHPLRHRLRLRRHHVLRLASRVCPARNRDGC